MRGELCRRELVKGRAHRGPIAAVEDPEIAGRIELNALWRTEARRAVQCDIRCGSLTPGVSCDGMNSTTLVPFATHSATVIVAVAVGVGVVLGVAVGVCVAAVVAVAVLQ